MKQRIIHSLDDLLALERQVVSSVDFTLSTLRARLQTDAGLSTLAALKFAAAGCDPLEPDRPLNFVEQLNQTFTYLATIEGTRWLFDQHPTSAPFVLNLGTAPGSDIVSLDRSIAAETFAATSPDSNRKLAKDVEKVRLTNAAFRYVFYLSPVGAATQYDGDVRVIRLAHACLPKWERTEA